VTKPARSIVLCEHSACIATIVVSDISGPRASTELSETNPNHSPGPIGLPFVKCWRRCAPQDGLAFEFYSRMTRQESWLNSSAAGIVTHGGQRAQAIAHNDPQLAHQDVGDGSLGREGGHTIAAPPECEFRRTSPTAPAARLASANL
jgi:hypothetical protein